MKRNRNGEKSRKQRKEVLPEIFYYQLATGDIISCKTILPESPRYQQVFIPEMPDATIAPKIVQRQGAVSSNINILSSQQKNHRRSGKHNNIGPTVSPNFASPPTNNAGSISAQELIMSSSNSVDQFEQAKQRTTVPVSNAVVQNNSPATATIPARPVWKSILCEEGEKRPSTGSTAQHGKSVQLASEVGVDQIQNEQQAKRNSQDDKLPKNVIHEICKMYVEYTSAIAFGIHNNNEKQEEKSPLERIAEAQAYFDKEFRPAIQKLGHEERTGQVPVFFLRSTLDILSPRPRFCEHCGIMDDGRWCSCRARGSALDLIDIISNTFGYDSEFVEFANGEVMKHFDYDPKMNYQRTKAKRRKVQKNATDEIEVVEIIIRTEKNQNTVILNGK